MVADNRLLLHIDHVPSIFCNFAKNPFDMTIFESEIKQKKDIDVKSSK